MGSSWAVVVCAVVLAGWTAGAAATCGTAQALVNGRCTACSWGQVAALDGNSCIQCSPGNVKVPDGYNVVDAQCVPASTACGSAQTAVNGRCSACTWGQVQGTDALSSCTACAPGTVKVPDGYNVVNATCQPASRIATPHFTHKKTTGCGGRVVVVSL